MAEDHNSTTQQRVRDYTLNDQIGAGGFGAVYRAHQHTLKREVAIKIILPQYANQPEFIQNFDSEAQLVAQIEHPHIVPIYDYWRDDSGAYIVMRLLRGGSLRDLIKKGPLDLNLSAQLFDEICRALLAAHRSGIVHRDLKPDNILLDETGNSYLADFGIAQPIGHQMSQDNISGSIAYMSPEQLMGKPPTPAADAYSLGIMLYEMLSGRHPFEPASPTQMMMKHIQEPFPQLLGLPEDVAWDINDLLQRLTSKEAESRFSDMPEIASTFRRIVTPGATVMDLQDVPVPSTEQGIILQQQIDFLYQQLQGLYDRPGSKPDTGVQRQIQQVQAQIDYRNAGLEAVKRYAPVVLPPVLCPPVEPAHKLVGVNHRLESVKGYLLENQSVILLGPSGAGKSELAAAVTRDDRIRAHYENRIVWLPMGKNPDLFTLFGEWLIAAGIPENDLAKFTHLETRTAQLLELIGDQQMLIIVDDLWSLDHLNDTLMSMKNQLVYVVTTWRAEISMEIPWEVVRVEALPVPERLALVSQLAREVKPEDPMIERLVLRVGGLARDLILISSRLRRAGNIASRLKKEVEKIIESPASVFEEGFESLRLCIEALSSEAQTALRILAQLPPEPNTIPETTAEALCGSLDGSYELVDSSLLRAEDDSYSLHPSFAEYARARLDAPDISRIVNYFVDFTQKHIREFNSLAPNSRNIEAALELAHSHRFIDAFISGVIGLYDFWEARGMLDTARKFLSTGLETAETPVQRAQLLSFRAHLLYTLGEVEQAEVDAKAGITEDSQNTRARMLALTCLANIRFDQGELEEGYALIKSAHDLAETSKNEGSLSGLNNLLATIAVTLEGDFEKAKTYYLKAVEYAKRAKDDARICVALQNLGLLEIYLRNYTQARQYLNDSLEIARKYGFIDRISGLLQNRGNLEYAMGNIEQARAYFEEAVQKARLSFNTEVLAWALMGYANILAVLNQFERAETTFGESLELAYKRKDSFLITTLVDVLCKIGEMRIIQHQHQFDDTVYVRTLKIAEEVETADEKRAALANVIDRAQIVSSNPDEASVLAYFNLALIDGQNEPLIAQTSLKNCLALATKTGNRGMRLDALMELVSIETALDQLESAQLHFNEALEISETNAKRMQKLADVFLTLRERCPEIVVLTEKMAAAVQPFDAERATQIRDNQPKE